MEKVCPSRCVVWVDSDDERAYLHIVLKGKVEGGIVLNVDETNPLFLQALATDENVEMDQATKEFFHRIFGNEIRRGS